jgi:hypothetical protein
VTTRETPIAVFKVTECCPGRGTEADLTPTASDSLVLVRTIAQSECSGAGGDWLIGREADASRDLHMGAHACLFIPKELNTATPVRWGVARTLQTAGLSSTPKGWCVHDLDGREPVTSSVVVRAWALYPSEAGARAALAAFKR